MIRDLAIFGPYPPPLGGISVHIQRIESFLLKENIDYRIYNHGFIENDKVISTNKSFFWYIKLLFVKRFKVFHFHQFFFFHFLYFFIFSWIRKEKVLITIHSERILTYSKIKKRLVVFFISKSNKLRVISVSKNLNDWLNSFDIPSVFLPAYVPPNKVVEKHLNITKPLFLFSVWKFNEELANEIYNVPLAFEYLKRHKSKWAMLFMIGSKKSSELEYLNYLINKYDIRDSVQLIFDENLVDYISNCKFILRPNLSDGYGVSLQESMDLGVPAIASDVCERPKGTILFKNNNIEDLSVKVNFTMTTPRKEILQKKEELKYHLKLIDFYLELIKQ